MEPIKWLGIILGITGFILIFLLIWMVQRHKKISHSIKVISIFAIFLLPFFSLLVANYRVFETSKEVKSCMDCHVMRPMGNDMMNPQSTTLAARHFRNHWINEQQCYGCHKDYGLNGTFKAKADGYRHLLTYITHTYKEPIQLRGEFNINNCLQCHEGTSAFSMVKEHKPVLENIYKGSKTISCLNCHGLAHPAASTRTPGHPEYEKLMKSFYKHETTKN